MGNHYRGQIHVYGTVCIGMKCKQALQVYAEDRIGEQTIPSFLFKPLVVTETK